MIFTFSNNNILIDVKCLSIISIRKLWESDNGKNKKIANNALRYIALMYDPDSPYSNKLPEDRNFYLMKEIYSFTPSENNKLPDELENLSSLFVNAVDEFKSLVITPEQRLLEGYKSKYEQILYLWENTEITDENIVRLAKDLPKILSDNIDLYAKLNSKINEKKIDSRNRGDVKNSFLDDPNKLQSLQRKTAK